MFVYLKALITSFYDNRSRIFHLFFTDLNRSKKIYNKKIKKSTAPLKSNFFNEELIYTYIIHLYIISVYVVYSHH